MFLISHCLLIYIYVVFMTYVFILCSVKSRIIICLLILSTHAFTHFVECFRKFCNGLYYLQMVVFLVSLSIAFVFCHELPKGEFVRF